MIRFVNDQHVERVYLGAKQRLARETYRSIGVRRDQDGRVGRQSPTKTIDRQFIVRRASQEANILASQRKSHRLLDPVQKRGFDQIPRSFGKIASFERFSSKEAGLGGRICDIKIGLPRRTREAIVAKEIADSARSGRRNKMAPAAHMRNSWSFPNGRLDHLLRDSPSL